MVGLHAGLPHVLHRLPADPHPAPPLPVLLRHRHERAHRPHRSHLPEGAPPQNRRRHAGARR